MVKRYLHIGLIALIAAASTLTARAESIPTQQSSNPEILNYKYNSSQIVGTLNNMNFDKVESVRPEIVRITSGRIRFILMNKGGSAMLLFYGVKGPTALTQERADEWNKTHEYGQTQIGEGGSVSIETHLNLKNSISVQQFMKVVRSFLHLTQEFRAYISPPGSNERQREMVRGYIDMANKQKQGRDAMIKNIMIDAKAHALKEIQREKAQAEAEAKAKAEE